ncbi:ankyrin repeat and SOCS box protein 18-like isoform X1 [Chiloscyllium plagiosum]|uniref:ankyrin repeat and SOCS box protein 18-like isoform X1 n=1 Tax=Chiloscyllium plagiosum TaxID=36176 RepID=UPI001CB7C677|nr:ankyrin repeat and SOCS box protein 18-like isoform X1 [Chiloscyllium plagiosum]
MDRDCVQRSQIFLDSEQHQYTGPSHAMKRRGPEAFHQALMHGDLRLLKVMVSEYREDVNMVFEVRSKEMEWQAKPVALGVSGYALPDDRYVCLYSFMGCGCHWQGLWSLEYKQELTSPLCIAAGHGYTDCLQYLLQRGAKPNMIVGTKNALHAACENAHTECTQQLLEHGANPRLLTEDGLSALHLCNTTQTFRCAKLLLKYRADVNQLSEDLETPLHVAAKQGLHNHVHLYLRYGATVNTMNGHRESPLGCACSNAWSLESQEDYLRVCQVLILSGADVNSVDDENRSPLHKASKNASFQLVQLLLKHKADVNAIDYNGCSPLANVIQTAPFKGELNPHRTVQTLLNHGSHRVWPAAFPKVLKSCADSPKTIEVLFNSYQQIQVTEEWMEAVPEELFQLHRPFYESLFALACSPRSLQHLCRFAARKLFGAQCHALIPRLPMPKCLRAYLLLEPDGLVC